MSRLLHPRLEDVALESVMHALSDSARLEIVHALDRDRLSGGQGLSCSCAAPDGLPRATMSNHFNVLRGAGLIEGRKQGTSVIHRLRREEVDARFPGLLDAVLREQPRS